LGEFRVLHKEIGPEMAVNSAFECAGIIEEDVSLGV
jgi:hypothetical protein